MKNTLYTDQGVGVDKRIAKGKTFISQNRNEADLKAKETKSYVYNLYEKNKGRLAFWGFAVPKMILLLFTLSLFSCSDDCDYREPQSVFIECDTQDNILRLDGVWEVNLSDDGEKVSSVGFWRNSPIFKVKSDDEITSLTLHGFNYDYTINYIDDFNVEIHSEYWENYFLDTDLVSITLLTLN